MSMKRKHWTDTHIKLIFSSFLSYFVMKMKGEKIVCCVGNFTEDLLKQKVLVQTKRKKENLQLCTEHLISSR